MNNIVYWYNEDICNSIFKGTKISDKKMKFYEWVSASGTIYGDISTYYLEGYVSIFISKETYYLFRSFGRER